MDVVGSSQFDRHAGNDIGEEDGAFGNVRTDKIKCCSQKDDIENVVDKA